MNWLSKLKVNLQSGFHVDEESVDIKRLIAIAEGADRPFYDDTGYWECLICGEDTEDKIGLSEKKAWKRIKHKSACPYSEDWKP